MLSKMKFGLTTQIFIAMILGCLAGIIFGEKVVVIKIVGDVWLNLVKMSIVPIILFVVMAGIVGQKDGKSLGRISIMIIIYYIATVIIASIVGIGVAELIQPGSGESTITFIETVKKPAPFSLENFLNMLVSDNVIKSMAEAKILQILVIGILFAVAIRKVPDQKLKQKLVDGIFALNAMTMQFVGMVMKVSPIGIFCLMAAALGSHGTQLLASIASLTLTFYIAFIVQILFIYCLTVWVVAGVNPISFIRKTAALWSFTIATCSSAAAIPIALNTCKEQFKCQEKVYGFTIPLGSQINHDGNAILFSCVIMFTAQIAGVQLSVFDLFQAVILGTLISSGGGGIPGSGVVKVMIMLQALGLPTEVGVIVASFYRIFDMGITTANCIGDVAGTVVVDRLEQRLSKNEVD